MTPADGHPGPDGVCRADIVQARPVVGLGINRVQGHVAPVSKVVKAGDVDRG